MASRSRIAVLLLATLVALGVFVLSPIPSRGVVDSIVDLTAVVTATECSPCHSSLGESDTPGLRFGHGTHLLVECAACHASPPHLGDRTVLPLMESCFLCHGLTHGEQGTLAPSLCGDCHTPEHQLRPVLHVEDWAELPHAEFAEQEGTNRCMMCHDSRKDCDVCHADMDIETDPIPPIYLRTIPIAPELPSVIVDTDAVPTLSLCIPCHAAIDDLTDPDVQFAHGPHLERDYKCSACHPVFPHALNETTSPDMLGCYRCHGAKHAAWGPVAPEECADCHPPAFELVPADHTLAFTTGEHSESAASEFERCTMCHTGAYCTECHVGGRIMANNEPSPQVVPEDHLVPEWQPAHGRKYLSQQGACSVCHSGLSCTRCHITQMPHPAEWLASHTGNGFTDRDCDVCHVDRTDCQECHHRSLGSQELVRANCIECHEEMDTDTPTEIKNIGLAEHAVHFDVVERVGRVYVCDDCHIGFTRMRLMQQPSQTQAHDLRACYDCHGALDFRKVLIAPWPGSELCRRCHSDMTL